MNKQNRIPERDEVLFAFHQACDNPTAAEITEWTKRYPQFAEDIRAHAAVRAEWASEPEGRDVEPDETMLARGRSHALNLLHSLRQDSAAAQNATEATWPQALSITGFDIARLA